jgi:YesN/AraC family two-component response regulator
MLPENAAASPHVLLVDDSLDELRLLIETLRHAQLRISVARDGNQAYARAVGGTPDLILMDVQMPRLDGFNALRLLKANPATADIPVIFLTACGEIDHRLEGLQNGGVDYVTKPFSPEEVLARIRIHLSRTSRPGDNPASETPQGLTGNQVLARAARQYLSEHLAQPPGVDELARRLGTHEKRLAAAFRQEWGVTVFEYIRSERLRLAQKMLVETSLRIVDIADELGFSTSANFATSFREQTGVTPSDFRKRSTSATESEKTDGLDS